MGISHQQRLYGQLLVDFANAVSTDEAGLKYFENIRKVFGFTDYFVVQAKDNFQTLKAFNALLKSKSEKCCFDFILKKADIEREIESPISGDSLEYDVYSKSFHFRELEVPSTEDGICIGYDKYTNKKLSVKKLREIILSDHANPIFKLRQEDVSKLILALETLAVQIRALKDISAERYKEISGLLPRYRNMMFEHGFIKKWQADLKSLLDQIVYPDPIIMNPYLDNIICMYNKIPKAEVFLSSDGTLKEEAPFKEDLLLNRENSFDTLLIYDGPISYCVIEFLKDNGNVEYLKKCRFCNHFFIAEDSRREFCYEPKECKKLFYNKDRVRRMREEYRNPDSKKFKSDYLR